MFIYIKYTLNTPCANCTVRRTHTIYLQIAFGHVLQDPDTVRPGVVVAGVTARGICTHLHLLMHGSLDLLSVIASLVSSTRLLLQPLQHPSPSTHTRAHTHYQTTLLHLTIMYILYLTDHSKQARSRKHVSKKWFLSNFVCDILSEVF